MANPESLAAFVELARELGTTRAGERTSAPAGP